MRRRLLVALLALPFVFMGGGSGVKLHVYEYPGYDMPSVLNYTADSYEYPQVDDYKDALAVQDLSFDFRGRQYELTYYDTSQKEFVPYEEENYRNTDGLEVSFKKGTGQVCGIRSENGLCISDLKNPETEEEFRQISDSFVKDYIVVENYTCSLTTEVAYFQQEGEKACRWFEKKDFFYTKNSEIESVQYIFVYTRYLDGFKTGDMAEVVLNPDGTLDTLILTNIGIFDDAKEQLVKQEVLDGAVLEKISAICPAGYQVGAVQSNVMVCMDEAGGVFFFVVANPDIREESNNIPLNETCFFIVVKE